MFSSSQSSKTQKLSIYYSLEPLLVVSKILGLYPHPVHIHHKNPYRLLEIVWSLFLMVFLTGYSGYSVQALIEPVRTKADLIGVMADITQVAISLADCIVTAAVLIFMGKEISRFMQDFVNFDQHFSDSPEVDYQYKQTRLKISVFLTFSGIFFATFTVVTAKLFLTEVSLKKIGSELVAFLYPMAVIALMVLQFCSFTFLLRQRFKLVREKLVAVKNEWNTTNRTKDQNSLLFNIFQNHKTDFSVSNLLENDRTVVSLEDIRMKHLQLTLISNRLGRVYSIPILITVLYIFVTITVTLFFSIIFNSNQKQNNPEMYYAYYVFVGLTNCTELLVLVWNCSSTAIEAQRIDVTLHEITNQSDELCAYTTHFSLYLKLNKVQFSGCRIFVLDETLLFSV